MDERTVEEPLRLMPRGLREKLVVAFSLMAVLPLLVLGYVVTNFVFPNLTSLWDLSLVVGLTLLLALLGFVVARQLVLPVIRMASDVQAIAQGELERRVYTGGPGEMGDLGMALNQVTQRVRENMAQLKIHGEQVHHLNLEINRRILVFSNILQVSNLITQSAEVEEIRAFILEKLIQLDEVELDCFLEPAGEKDSFLVQSCAGVDLNQTGSLLHTKLVSPWLQKILSEHRFLLMDSSTTASYEREVLQQLLGVENAACIPIRALGKGVGVLVCANRRSNFAFGEDTLEFLHIFARQLAIAIENDGLIKRAQELEVLDQLTGLYNATYLKQRLTEEVQRAIRYHRSCSLLLLNLDDFQEFEELCGGLAAESALRQVAQLLRGEVSDVDRVGRWGSDEFAVILPERNKRESIALAEGIRRKMEETDFVKGSKHPSRLLTVSVGVSENPLDGATSEGLFLKAQEAVKLAKKQGKNRVVAH